MEAAAKPMVSLFVDRSSPDYWVVRDPEGNWIELSERTTFTGRPLAPHEGNIDHVKPRALGGQTSWENCVLAHRDINTRKGNRMPEEIGLRLLKRPAAPRELPVTFFIRNKHGIADWEHFLAG